MLTLVMLFFLFKYPKINAEFKLNFKFDIKLEVKLKFCVYFWVFEQKK